MNFRNKLLSMVTDPARKGEIEKIKDDYAFVGSLVSNCNNMLYMLLTQIY